MKNRTLKISKEDYLEAILVCIKKYGACRVTDVADQLGHSKASVSVALSKLENEGLVVKDDWSCRHIPRFSGGFTVPW